MAIFLNAAAYDDGTYRFEGGKLCKFAGDSVSITKDTYLVVQPGDGITFIFNDSETYIDLWNLIVDSGLVKNFYKHHQMYIDCRFLHAIELYYMSDGYADLSLAEFVGKMYGAQQDKNDVPFRISNFNNRPRLGGKGRRL